MKRLELGVVHAVLLRTWLKTLRRPVVLSFSFVQPLVWMLFFGFLFARYRIADVPEFASTDLRYLDFLAPGVCAMTVLFGASQSGIPWIRDMHSGFLGRCLASPASRFAQLSGKVLADALRLCAQAAVVVLLALLLGARFSPSLGALAVGLVHLFLFALAFSALSCAIALFTRAQEAMAVFVHIVNMPILFTSTALVPVKQMPDWLAMLSRGNPLTIAVDAWRGALLFGEMPGIGGVLVLASLSAGLLWLARSAMERNARHS